MPVETSVLIHLLDSPNEYERRGAADELGQLPTSSFTAVQALQRLALNDGSARVRQAAAEALQSPAHKALLENLPSRAPALPASAPSPKSRNHIAIGNLFARSAIAGVLVVAIALWFLLAYGYSSTRLVFVIDAAAVCIALFLTSRWIDQGRRAAVLLYAGIVLSDLALSFVWVHSLNWFLIAIELFYFVCLASLWRTGELK